MKAHPEINVSLSKVPPSFHFAFSFVVAIDTNQHDHLSESFPMSGTKSH